MWFPEISVLKFAIFVAGNRFMNLAGDNEPVHVLQRHCRKYAPIFPPLDRAFEGRTA
jgi:hypothetical protein